MEASLLALQVHFHLTKGRAKKLTGRHRGASSWPSRPPGPQHEKKMRLYEDSKHAPVSATATAVGRSGKYAPLFVSSAALTLICKWSPKFYTYVCICICLGTGTFSNPNGEIVKLLFIGPPRPRFIPLVLSCRRSAVQGKERGIHLPAGHVDRGSCFSPGRGSLSSFIRVIN